MKKYIKYGYASLLAFSAFYYFVLFAVQFNKPYETWSAWAQPAPDLASFSILAVIYLIAAGTPSALLLSAYQLAKHGKVHLYLVLALIPLLLFASLIGKLVLLLGVVYVFIDKINHGYDHPV